jgi:hypothetical protein
MSAYWVSRDIATWRVVDDEAVIIHVQTSDYFSLNQTGTFIWSQLAERPHTASQMAELVARRCGRNAADVGPDVAAFFAQLQEAKLLSDGRPPQPVDGTAIAGASAAYEPPQLVRFGDLETLILSGE